MLWRHVTHNIPTPTTYTMDRRCPQHIPTTCKRYPQHIVTHKGVVHNIHPQHKNRCPQHMSVMDTRTTYTMLSTTYVWKKNLFPTIVSAYDFYVVGNISYVVDNSIYMLWTTPTGYVVGVYIVENIEDICCGCICCGEHSQYMLWVHMLWTTFAVYVVGNVACHPQHMSHVVHNISMLSTTCNPQRIRICCGLH